MQLHIDNMTCGGCVRGVTKAILSVDPLAQVTADPETRKVMVGSTLSSAPILAVLHAAGFSALLQTGESQ